MKVPVNLSQSDLQNLIAFGNRAQMSGQEADTWVELKHRMAREFEAGAKPAEAEDEPRGLRAVAETGDDAA